MYKLICVGKGVAMKKRFYLYAISLFVLLATVVTLNMPTTSQALTGARDCDANAVMYCGATSQNELQTKYTSNSTGDLDDIYSAFGISAGDIAGTSSEIKIGQVTKDGHVLVDGKTVATGAVTMGRENMTGSTAITINGKTYYQRTPSVSFGSSALDAFVLMRNGEFYKAIIMSCGNPVKAEKVAKPVASCTGLTANKISRTEYTFTATASTDDGATISSYVFMVTGGTSGAKTFTVTTSAKTATTEKITLPSAGLYNISVVVKTSLGDRTSNDCKTSITIVAPPAPTPGISVTKHVDSVDRKVVNVNQEFTYQIIVKNTGNTELKNVVITDTPEAGVTLISAGNNLGTITNNTWKYTLPSLKVGEQKEFTLKAKVPSYVSKAITNTVCVDAPEIQGAKDDCDEAIVEVPAPNKVSVCDATTGKVITVDETEKDKYKPVGDEACKPKVLGTTTTPTVIASTGPTEILAGTAGLGSLTAAGYYFQSSRRRVLSSLLKK